MPEFRDPYSWTARGIAEATGAHLVSGRDDATRMSLLGPAGTGKTTRLVHLFLAAQRRFGPKAARMITFTRKAAETMRKKLKAADADATFASTLHSTCARLLSTGPPGSVQGHTGLLGPYLDFSDTDHRRAFRTRFGFDPGEADVDDPFAPPDRLHLLLRLDEQARLSRGSASQVFATVRSGRRRPEWGPAELARFIAAYEAFRRQHELLDHTDLLERALEGGVALSAACVLGDEGQDWSPLEWAVLRSITASSEVVVVAGDPAQSICFFKGADERDFLRFGAARLQLDLSFRVPATLVRVANATTSRGRSDDGRLPVRAVNPGGTFSLLRSLEDVRWSAGTFLVLARARKTLFRLERELENLLVPFAGLCGLGVPQDGPVALAMRVAVRLHRDGSAPAPDISRLRRGTATGLWGEPCFSFDASDPESIIGLDDLRSAGASRELIKMLRAGCVSQPLRLTARRRAYLDAVGTMHGLEALMTDPTVRTLTIHAAKGDEADFVVVSQDWATLPHRELVENPWSERNVAHVAATRACKGLFLLRPASRRNGPFPQPVTWYAGQA